MARLMQMNDPVSRRSTAPHPLTAAAVTDAFKHFSMTSQSWKPKTADQPTVPVSTTPLFSPEQRQTQHVTRIGSINRNFKELETIYSQRISSPNRTSLPKLSTQH